MQEILITGGMVFSYVMLLFGIREFTRRHYSDDGTDSLE